VDGEEILMGRSDHLIEHDFNRICDQCGFKFKASETRKQWDGLIVCDSCFDARHPLDFVRGRRDRQNVPEPRPQATTPTFVSGTDVYVDDNGAEYTDDGGIQQYVG
jgi:hypothetical protein